MTFSGVRPSAWNQAMRWKRRAPHRRLLWLWSLNVTPRTLSFSKSALTLKPYACFYVLRAPRSFELLEKCTHSQAICLLLRFGGLMNPAPRLGATWVVPHPGASCAEQEQARKTHSVCSSKNRSIKTSLASSPLNISLCVPSRLVVVALTRVAPLNETIFTGISSLSQASPSRRGRHAQCCCFWLLVTLDNTVV